MDLIDLFIIAIALSAGFFGVSYNGSKLLKTLKPVSLAAPLIFGLVSTILLSIGYFIGLWIKTYFENYEYHLTFFIIAGLGIKVFLEGTGKKKSHTVYVLDDIKIIFGAALIYSINYFIAGICLFLFSGNFIAVLGYFIVISIATSLIGLLMGRTIKYHLSDFVLITSGIILIAIAAKILMTYTGYI